MINHALIGGLAFVGGAQSDVIRFNAKCLQAFLNINPHATATAPQAYNEGRAETAAVDLSAETERVFDHRLFGQKAFMHCLVAAIRSGRVLV